VDETEKASSTICCQDKGWPLDRVDSDRLGVSVAGFDLCINRESFLAITAFSGSNRKNCA
jgi:hypothetical protein